MISILLTERSASPSLSLRVSPGQGFHVHIGRGKRDAVKLRSDANFIPISSSASTCTFYCAVSVLDQTPKGDVLMDWGIGVDTAR